MEITNSIGPELGGGIFLESSVPFTFEGAIDLSPEGGILLGRTTISGRLGLALGGGMSLQVKTPVVISGDLALNLEGGLAFAAKLPFSLGNDLGLSLDGGFSLNADMIVNMSGGIGQELTGGWDIYEKTMPAFSGDINLELDGYISLLATDETPCSTILAYSR